MTPDEFRKAGHAVVDFIADYRERIAERPVMAQTAPGDVKAGLPASPPADPEPFERILQDVDRLVLPGLTHWQHPAFFGYFPGNSTARQRARRLRQHGPRRARARLAVEPGADRSRRGRRPTGCGRWSDCRTRWRGVIQDTASTSTLIALLCARERTTNFSMTGGGLQAEAQAADRCTPRRTATARWKRRRSSPDSAATTCVSSPCDETLRDARGRARRARSPRISRPGGGRAPWSRPIGTTATTAVDPLEPIAAVAERHGLWLHVDAAMAGSAMILPECRVDVATASSARTRLSSTRTSGWASRSTARVYYVRDARASRARDVHQSELSAVGGRRPGEELSRLGHPARPPFPRAEAVVPDPRTRRDARCRRGCGATSPTRSGWPRRSPPTPGWRLLAPVKLQTVCVRHEPRGGRRRRARSPHARLVRSHQSLRPGVSDAGRARRPLDGARVDRQRADGTLRTSRRCGS